MFKTVETDPKLRDYGKGNIFNRCFQLVPQLSLKQARQAIFDEGIVSLS